MADFSLKQFLLNGGQFLEEGRPRSNSMSNAPKANELTRKQEQDGGGDGGSDRSSKTETNQSRRKSLAPSSVVQSDPISSVGLAARRRMSIANPTGSSNNSTKHEIEKTGELSRVEGDDNGRGRIRLSFHYSRETQTLTLKVIQAKELRCGHGGEVCAFVTISFLPTSKVRMETKARMMTGNPIWKEVFLIRNFLEEDFKEHKAFVFEVWDKTSNGTSQLIGEAVILLRCLKMDELLEKGVVLWKYLCMSRQESELSLGQLIFYVRQCRSKKRLTVMIEKVNNAAIPASAKQPSLYMKIQLLRDEAEVLSERTKTVSNSFSPVFNHKMHISLQSGSMHNASLKLVLKQEANARLESLSSVQQQHCQKTIGVMHLSMYADRDDLVEAWKQILTCQDEKMHFKLKFSAPLKKSVEG